MERSEVIYILRRLDHVSCVGYENCTVGGAIQMAIEALEQPEIIHCAECEKCSRFMSRRYLGGEEKEKGFCDRNNNIVELTDYCSLAERKEDGEK